jgi:hypothetical protein
MLIPRSNSVVRQTHVEVYHNYYVAMDHNFQLDSAEDGSLEGKTMQTRKIIKSPDHTWMGNEHLQVFY